jgi:hypothetical protein
VEELAQQAQGQESVLVAQQHLALVELAQGLAKQVQE